MQQCANKGRKEEAFQQASVDANNAGLRCFNEEGNALKTFVRPQRYKDTMCFDEHCWFA